MKNDLFSIGPLTVRGYGLMIAIGVIAAYIVAERRAKNRGMRHDLIIDLAIWCLLSGVAGAKLLFILVHLGEIIADPSTLLPVTSGFLMYGGILGGVLAAYIFCRRKGLRFAEYFDLIIPSVALAQGIGRIGCLLSGCCYGIETQSAFGIVFHDSQFAPNGVPLVPTQIISCVLDLALFAILIMFSNRKKRPDFQVFSLYLTLYGFGRFFMEFIRGDTNSGTVWFLTTSQVMSAGMFIAGLALLIFIGRHARSLAAATDSGDIGGKAPDDEPPGKGNDDTPGEASSDGI